jgi:hypothetical protein
MRGSFNILAGLCLAAVMVLAGCGAKSATSALSDLAVEFQSADPALKAKADLAVSSFKTNDYVTAVVSLQGLQNAAGLAPKQQKTVEDALDAVYTRVFEGATKGDPQALEARDTLRKMQKRPGAN